MSFRITGLPRTRFADLIGLSDDELKSRGVLRRIADHKPGFPCRVSLRDAEPGESVLLVNYEHQPASTPFRSTYAVYVREASVREAGAEASLAIGELPDVFRSRTLSLRAFDRDGMLIDADLADGAEPEPTITRLLANPAAAYLHAHYAKPGCYAARIDRA